MGGLSRILITGATGFVGAAVVRAARAAGIEVVAVARSEGPADWVPDTGIDILRLDLTAPDAAERLRPALSGADAVIHAAAHLGGDADAVEADTIRGTEGLLSALGAVPARLVLVSSIAVYDTMRLAPGSAVTEASPLETPETARDAYTRGKLLQERMVHESGRPAWILRPGVVYGPGRSWHALMGFWASRLSVTIASDGELPLVHVDHLAEALLAAAGRDPGGIRALTVVDDDRPDRARFLAAHRRLAGWPKASVSVPYGAWLTLARVLKPASTAMPGLLREPILRARMMPLRYPNTALREALGGHDHAPFEAMLARSIGGDAA